MDKTPVRLSADEELEPTPGPNESLPPISIFATRSFWLLLGAVLIPLARLLGYEPPFGSEELADAMMTVIPAILALLAYTQRAAPNFRLVFWR